MDKIVDKALNIALGTMAVGLAVMAICATSFVIKNTWLFLFH